MEEDYKGGWGMHCHMGMWPHKKELKIAMLEKKEKILEAQLDFIKRMKDMVKKMPDEKEKM